MQVNSYLIELQKENIRMPDKVVDIASSKWENETRQQINSNRLHENQRLGSCQTHYIVRIISSRHFDDKF